MAGDLLSDGSLVVKELTFREWTRRIDESMVEYSLEDAYEHWLTNGPRLEVINSDGQISYVWSS